MGYSRESYLAFAYGVPFGAFGIIFVFITIIHKRVNWFLLHTILGIDWHPDEDVKSSSKNSTEPAITSNDTIDTAKNQPDSDGKSGEKRLISTYLYVDLDGDEQKDISPLICIIRFLSDLLASAILAIFVAIIFDSLIMTNERVSVGAKCPNFDAECFGTNGSSRVGPFNCSDGQYANFSIDSSTVWCAGWVFRDRGINDVLGTLGTCGGLIGIISSIVPFVYYLSFYKKCFCLSLSCIILPLLPIGALGFTLWFTLPQGPSQLAIVVFSVAIAMTFIGWSWALYRSYSVNKSFQQTPKKYGCCSCCSLDDQSCFGTPYRFYPWCWCYRRCMRCFSRGQCGRVCCESCAEEGRKANQSARKRDSSSLSATPISIKQPPSSAKQSSSFNNASKKVAW